MTSFLEIQPTAENRWRALVLLGRNTASYKFALAQALLQVAREPDDLIKLEDLAVPFAAALSEHVQQAPKQGTTNINRAMRQACEGYNAGRSTKAELQEVTVRHGFGDVIDAFHVLGGAPLQQPFFVDERREAKGIRLTEEMRKLAQLRAFEDLAQEVEARWRVVETGWELGVHAGIVEYDQGTGNLSLRSPDRRLALRSCRSTLQGYQKGKCFYCFAPITLDIGTDVDHFFPWARRSLFAHADGIWNLVLACRDCNRGVGGKSDSVPTSRLLSRLHQRNEFYVDSKHKMATTILRQTGASQTARRAFLQQAYADLTLASIRHWEPQLRGAPAF